MAHYDGNPPPALVKSMIRKTKGEGTGLPIGCDANSHHDLWGNSDVNERDKSLFEYII